MIDVVRNIAIAYRAHMPPEVDNKPTCIAYMFTCVDTQENRQTDRQTGLHTHRNTLLPQGTVSAHRQLNWLVFTQMQARRQGRGVLGTYEPPK